MWELAYAEIIEGPSYTQHHLENLHDQRSGLNGKGRWPGDMGFAENYPDRVPGRDPSNPLKAPMFPSVPTKIPAGHQIP